MLLGFSLRRSGGIHVQRCPSVGFSQNSNSDSAETTSISSRRMIQVLYKEKTAATSLIDQ